MYVLCVSSKSLLCNYMTLLVFVFVCVYLWLECFDFLAEVSDSMCCLNPDPNCSALNDMLEERNAQFN